MDTALLGYHGVGAARWSTGQDRGWPAPLTAAHGAGIYDQQTVAALTKLWRHFGYLCGKRLAATLRLWLPHYEGWNARSKRKIALTPEVRAKLLRISPATIDRLLRAEKRKLLLRGLSHTKKPTGTLMLQIPIRTFSEWQNVPVGTLGMDLVGHDGGSAQGEFASPGPGVVATRS